MKTIRYCALACLAAFMLAACHKDDEPQDWPQEEQVPQGINDSHNIQSDRPAYIRRS